MLRPISPFIEYMINYDYISKVLCINKNKPELSCNGKCHLMKTLKKEQEKVKKEEEKRKNKEEKKRLKEEKKRKKEEEKRKKEEEQENNEGG